MKCLRCQIEVQNHWFFSCLYCLFRFWTFVLFHGLSCRHHSQENPNEIWINVQGCFVIQLSRFCFHAKAFIFYHIDSCLSRTFLSFFSFFSEAILLPSSISFRGSCSFMSCNFYILSHMFYLVKNFFHLSEDFLSDFFQINVFSCATYVILSQQHNYVKLFYYFFFFTKSAGYYIYSVMARESLHN